MSADRTGTAARYHVAADERINRLLDWVDEHRTVLEIGCATGHVTAELAARGHEVVGIEIDPASAETARSVASAVFVADLDTTSISSAVDAAAIPPGGFDAIVAGDVLEHLRDPVAALREAVTMLTPGGVIAISLPNIAFHDARLALLEGEWTTRPTGLLDETHLRFFTRSSVFALAHAAGLVVTDFGRIVRRPGTTNVVPEHRVLSSLVDELLVIDPNAAAYQFVARFERRTPDTERIAAAVEAAVLAEEQAARLQARQILATYDNDRAALLKLRRDYLDLANSRMVRWGSMPRRSALALRRLAGRILRALRLRK